MKTDSMQGWCAVLVGAIALGCGGGGGSGGGGPGGAGGGTSRPGDTGGSGGGTTTSSNGPSCSTPDDCPNWFCDCRSGPPVNSRRCINNRCVDAASSCGSACAGFGTCWLGTAGGGFPGGSNAGPSTCTGSGAGGGSGGTSCTETDLGKGCSGNSQCQSNLCFGGSGSFICTKGCTAANDCPRFWQCQSVASGGAVCMSGTTLSPSSTSNACSPFSINDVGAPCNSGCQGGFCVMNMCSRRCDGSNDCPSSWRCVPDASGSVRVCTP